MSATKAHVLVAAASAMLAALTATPAAAQSAACSNPRSELAMAALPKAQGWAGLRRYYHQFSACDDGGLADDVTERVVHDLAHHWSWLATLNVAIKGDPGFERYVLGHIDSTADTDDLTEIKRTATVLCPPSLTGLCRKVRTAAVTALR